MTHYLKIGYDGYYQFLSLVHADEPLLVNYQFLSIHLNMPMSSPCLFI